MLIDQIGPTRDHDFHALPDVAIRHVVPRSTPEGVGGLAMTTVARHLTARQWRIVILVAALTAIAVLAAWGDRWRTTWWKARVEAAERRGDYAAALAALDRLPGGAGRTWLERGRLLRRSGDLLAADRCFTAALEAGHEPTLVNRERLLAEAQCGDITDVEDQVLALVRAGGSDALADECYAAMAEGYVNAFRFADAARCLEFWQAWRKDDPQLHLIRGRLEERLGHAGLAFEAYREGLRLAPQRIDLRLAVARLELDAARLDVAAEILRAVRRARPDDGSAVLGLAQCRLRQGDVAGGTTLIHEALSLDLRPEDAAVALTELAQLALEDGEAQRSVALARGAVALDPRNERCLLGLAAGLVREGDAAGAAAAQARARALADGRRRLSSTLMTLGTRPDDADLRADAGEILIEQGFGPAGMRWLETAVQVDPRHQRARRLLADGYSGVGDEARAAEHRRWIEAGPAPGAEAAP